MKLWTALLSTGLATLPLSAGEGRYYPLPVPSARFAPALAEARDQVQVLMRDRQIPGLTAAAFVDGQLVWSEGFGFADLENGVRVWPNTKMRAGSVSKSLTSVAVALLVQAGRLDLDAPIQRYVPYFPPKDGTVTVRLLAGHLAGIRGYLGGDDGPENMQQAHFSSVRAGLAFIAADPLVHPPGSRYLYSSFGWNLISAAVEGASGEEFLTYMQSHVFDPAGLRDTIADHPFELIPHRSRFYISVDGRLTNAPYVDNSYKWASGGFLSTAEDLARFGSKLIDGALIPTAAMESLFASQKTLTGEATGSGMDWYTGDENGIAHVYEPELAQRIVDRVKRKTSERWRWHTGGSVGGNAVLIVFPDNHVTVAMMSNKSPVGRQLLEAAAELGAELVRLRGLSSPAAK